jgi:hypothetical protein
MTCEELEEQFCTELQKVKPKWKITSEILKELREEYGITIKY